MEPTQLFFVRYNTIQNNLQCLKGDHSKYQQFLALTKYKDRQQYCK